MDDEPDSLWRVELDQLLDALSEFPTDVKFLNDTSLTSPMDILQRQRFLSDLKKDELLGDPIPCDALIFGYEDVADRMITKVGGVPYWPESKPWPKARDGRPFEFLAQFNFLGSREILVPTPGEMLTVFVQQHNFEMREFWMEWQFPNSDIACVAAENIPEVDEPLVMTPAYGVPCRLEEYPHARLQSSQISINDWASLTTIKGSKIGGVPYFFRTPELEITGTFICALHSLRHPVFVPWPFLNVEEPLTPQMLGGVGCQGGRGCHDTVSFADLGALYFYLQDDGSVRILLQSHSCEEFLNEGLDVA